MKLLTRSREVTLPLNMAVWLALSGMLWDSRKVSDDCIPESEAHCRERFDYMSPGALLPLYAAGRNLLIGHRTQVSNVHKQIKHRLTASKVCSHKGKLSKCKIYLCFTLLEMFVRFNVTVLERTIFFILVSLFLSPNCGYKLFFSTVGLVFQGNVYIVNENLFLCLQFSLAYQIGCCPLCSKSLLCLSHFKIWTWWT